MILDIEKYSKKMTPREVVKLELGKDQFTDAERFSHIKGFSIFRLIESSSISWWKYIGNKRKIKNEVNYIFNLFKSNPGIDLSDIIYCLIALNDLYHTISKDKPFMDISLDTTKSESIDSLTAMITIKVDFMIYKLHVTFNKTVDNDNEYYAIRTLEIVEEDAYSKGLLIAKLKDRLSTITKELCKYNYKHKFIK